LEGGSGIASRTVASCLYYWNKGEQGLTPKTVLVVDEAGMLGSRQMGRLIEEVHRAGAKLVQVGDFEQLQAIEAGAAFRGIAERLGYVTLTEIRRQTVAWQKEATQDFARGDTQKALAAYQAHTHIHCFETQAAAQEGLIAIWQDVRHSQPEIAQIILAYTREETKQLNMLARAQLEKEGALGISVAIPTERGERLFASGDRIYFLKNDRGLGVMNGTLGTVEQVTPYRLTVRLDPVGKDPSSLRQVQLELQHYPHIEHGYAATIHKAQGVTVDRSYILASPYLDRHATYVAMTRHRQSADVFWSKDQFKNEKALFSILGRERAKDWSLDYGQIEVEVFRESEKHLETKLLSEKERLEAFLKEGLERAEQGPREKSPTTASLEAFKAQFEKEHPQQAQKLQQSVLTQQERLGMAAVEKFHQLEKAARILPTQEAVKQLGKYAATLKLNAATWGYLKAYHAEMATQITELAKPYEKVQRLERQRSLDEDRGGGRHL
jgi:hypothetical protein